LTNVTEEPGVVQMVNAGRQDPFTQGPASAPVHSLLRQHWFWPMHRLPHFFRFGPQLHRFLRQR
jgi:hypothetical protein